MEIFSLTLSQMLMMFVFIMVGFLLRKKNIFPDNSYITLSRLETYVFLPALNLYTQMTNCTAETFAQNSTLMLYGLAIIIPIVLLSYPFSKLFVKKGVDECKRDIYKYAITFGNFGFMGNFIVLGIWGSEVFFKYSMFTFLITIVSNTWGLYLLIPKEKNGGRFLKNITKGLFVPPTIALFAGIIMGLLNVKEYVPDFLVNALSNASDCMGPVAMLLVGVVIGGYDVKKLFVNKKVYFVTALRLIIIPGIIMTILKLLGAGEEILIFALIAFATPLGLNTIIFPAAYGSDTKTGASMAMISHIFSVITMPLMYLLFIILW